MRLWHNININDGRHPSEVIRQTDFDARLRRRLVPRQQLADGVTALHRQRPIAIQFSIAFTWHTRGVIVNTELNGVVSACH